MKRSRPPARSTTPIARRTRPPKARKRIRTRKADPSKRRWAKHRCKPFTDWLKQQSCCVTGLLTGDCIFVGRLFIRIYVDPAHLRPRSTGGFDLYGALPLSRHLHDEQHDFGWPRFEAKYHLDRVAIAADCTERWLATPDGVRWAEQYRGEA